MNPMEARGISQAAANDWGSRSHVRTLVLMAATACGIYLCYLLAMPLLPALAWALALAVLFTPFQRWLESKLKNPSWAAFISVMAIGLIVVVPATFVSQHLVLQAAKGAAHIEEEINAGDWRQTLEAQPRLAPLADWIEQEMDLPGLVKSGTTWLSATAGTIVKRSVFQIIGFFLIFYMLFYFLRDRRDALHALRSLSPLSHHEMDQMFHRVADTIHATIYGTLAVACVQGLLGGLMFWVLGLPAPLLWGVVMGLLAVVPVLGAFVVWIPAAFVLGLEGSWGKALMLTVWGTLIVGTIDNLLHPFLVGKRLKMHTLLAFISVIGGLMLFGTSGLILGPVVLTITIELLGTWRARSEASPPGQAAMPKRFIETQSIQQQSTESWENEGGEILPVAAVSQDLRTTPAHT